MLFQAMADAIREDSVRMLFRAEVQSAVPEEEQKKSTALPGVKDGRVAAAGKQVKVPGLAEPKRTAGA